ncbi:hypothetical protein ACHAPE_007575 [Trichoderma viride]
MLIYMTDCLRCDRSFKTQSARAQHMSDSSRHNICRECYYLEDFETAYELREHMIDEHNGCTQCSDTFESVGDLRQHLYDEHNMCSHQLVHRERSIECFACCRAFVTKSAMVLHLEQGTCSSGVNLIDVNDYARDCYTSDQYLDCDGDYECPTCHKYFKYMSGLLQHAESDNCNETLKRRNSPLAIFLRFLKARV